MENQMQMQEKLESFTELKQIAYTGYVINFNLGGALCDRLVAPDLDLSLSATVIPAGVTCTIAFVGTTDFTHWSRQ
jgi:hypothetical protein